LVADHDELRPKSGKNVAREARAAGAKVSPATMARADQAEGRLFAPQRGGRIGARI
jgi:hypothetical protein